MKKNPYDFVLDCSVTMAWCFEDEGNDFTESVLNRLSESKAIVPTIWSLEVANVLLVAKRKKRILEFQCSRFIDALSAFGASVLLLAPWHQWWWPDFSRKSKC